LNLFAGGSRSWWAAEIPQDGSGAECALHLFAPAFSALWIHLDRRNLDPSTRPSSHQVLLGLGFLVMVGAATVVASGRLAGPQWLLLAYLLHCFGELCLSPVGLSSVTKLAPPRFVGQMMGLWFLATSLGLLLAGLVPVGSMRDLASMPANT
jgi:POT family proton-dependent oligopeptide transporter